MRKDNGSITLVVKQVEVPPKEKIGFFKEIYSWIKNRPRSITNLPYAEQKRIKTGIITGDKDD